MAPRALVIPAEAGIQAHSWPPGPPYGSPASQGDVDSRVRGNDGRAAAAA